AGRAPGARAAQQLPTGAETITTASRTTTTAATSCGTGVGSPSDVRSASIPTREARYVTIVARRPARPRRYMANAPTASTITSAMLREFVELPTIHTPAETGSARPTRGGTPLG